MKYLGLAVCNAGILGISNWGYRTRGLQPCGLTPWGSVVIADYEAAFFYSALSLSPKIEQLVIRRNQQLGVLIWDVALITARARTI